MDSDTKLVREFVTLCGKIPDTPTLLLSCRVGPSYVEDFAISPGNLATGGCWIPPGRIWGTSGKSSPDIATE
jgi:hypothetical protein